MIQKGSLLRRMETKMKFSQKFSFTLSRGQLLIYTIILIFTANITIFLKYRQNATTRIIHYLNANNDITCYSTPSHNLPFADGKNFTPSAKSIYFHETSCKGGLNSRQACSIESAARAHPNWQVNVLFLGPVKELTLKDGILTKLQEFPNVKMFRIDIAKFAQGTPLEQMMAKNIFLGKDSVQQASDVMKYLTLFKWGGMCFDLDVMVLKSFDTLAKNFATRQDADFISSAVISLSRDKLGRNVSLITMRELQKFRPDLWCYNGPGVITRTLAQFCSIPILTTMSADSCEGFEVYHPRYFYPIHYTCWERYFEPLDINIKEEHVYAHHFWNFLSAKTKVPKDSLYVSLAKEYCPSVYEMYDDDFGD